MKHIVCFSGGHSSAIVAIEVVRKYGKENCILLNHNINSKVEDIEIKNFKQEIANYLQMSITYANHNEWETKDQFDVCIDAKAFKTKEAPALCTSRLKTQPFLKWLQENKNEYIIYYGFDKEEDNRINRRTKIMEDLGYKTDYPLANWKNRTIFETNEIGIEKPLQYNNFKHANCIGCLKGGSLHWYVVYCIRPDIFNKAMEAEEKIGYSIIKGKYLKEMQCDFSKMKKLGIKPTEHIPHQQFWKNAKKILNGANLFNYENYEKECKCT